MRGKIWYGPNWGRKIYFYDLHNASTLLVQPVHCEHDGSLIYNISHVFLISCDAKKIMCKLEL